MQGEPLRNHTDAAPAYIPSVNAGHYGGGTYTSQSIEPTLEAYENIFGPSARDIKQDLQRFKRHGRWHLPDILKGPNQYLTDRIDGLITDATQSPFTSRILPYKYITNVDGKIKWNVWSFDEGLSSRVPYESAARTLTQTKRSFAGYTIRQGMAIVLEHNFMMTETGRQNFKNQLQQLVGSIQLTNDLDVHVALVLAPSHEKHMREKYMVEDKSPAQVCREFVDLFGFVQKNQNALDILIEEAKATLRAWGSPMPDFMLCNSKLTFQLTMTPDATNYVTKGAEGVKRLRTGPDLPSYRGIGIVHTRAFSMETGQLPRDILRRRVRVAEYYRILPHRDNHRRLFSLYNEERDTWAAFTFGELLKKAVASQVNGPHRNPMAPGHDNADRIQTAAMLHAQFGGPAPALPKPAAALGTELGKVQGSTRDQLQEVLLQVLDDKTTKKFNRDLALPIDKGVLYAPGADPLLVPTNEYANGRRGNLSPLVHDALDHFDRLKGIGAGAAPGVEHNRMLAYKVNSVCSYPRTLAEFEGLLAISNGRGAQGYTDISLPDDYMTIKYSRVAPDISRAAALEYRKASLFSTRLNANDTEDEAGRHVAAAVIAYNAALAADAVPGGPGNTADATDLGSIHDAVNPAAARSLQEKILYRNFRRYAVPLDVKRGADLTEGDVAFDSALSINADRDTANPYSGYLRRRGAFYCPNYFDGDTDFQNWGDYIGYNALLLSDTIANLCHKTRGGGYRDRQMEMYPGTWLYFALTTNNSAIKNAFKRGLEQLRDAIKADPQKTRLALGLELATQIDNIYNAHPNGFDQADPNIRYYWLWPNCDSALNDVYRKPENSTLGWVKAMHKYIPAFHVHYELNRDVATQIQERQAIFPACKLTQTLPDTRGLKTTVTDNDVVNFMSMLAWRLWSDRTRPLSEVYRVPRGVWPAFAQYCSERLEYPYDQIGIGLCQFALPIEDRAHGLQPSSRMADLTEDIEVVIVRPNIEHYMLGIILGQGGESLGSTFWGQTELSCYDDSMHGIWGMSYKYNERAIVINERNLVRLWDIAYDGYVGGKDDTAVDWDDTSEQHRHSQASLVKHTMDVTMPYRGPSMMVMAFDHGKAKQQHAQEYQQSFKSNWPSPIVFYDRLNSDDQVSLASDFDNIHVVSVGEFRVFNNPLYMQAYKDYQDKMPDFYELHRIRKNAGLAAVENEVSSDALAFQGTMRVINAESGSVIQEVLGSGHHGPDFVGVASLRAGKGYKINSQPTIQRLV